MIVFCFFSIDAAFVSAACIVCSCAVARACSSAVICWGEVVVLGRVSAKAVLESKNPMRMICVMEIIFFILYIVYVAPIIYLANRSANKINIPPFGRYILVFLFNAIGCFGCAIFFDVIAIDRNDIDFPSSKLGCKANVLTTFTDCK